MSPRIGSASKANVPPQGERLSAMAKKENPKFESAIRRTKILKAALAQFGNIRTGHSYFRPGNFNMYESAR